MTKKAPQNLLSSLKSAHFPYRSTSAALGVDEEEERRLAAHSGVLPHLCTAHHSPALHYEASESPRGVEKR